MHPSVYNPVLEIQALLRSSEPEVISLSVWGLEVGPYLQDPPSKRAGSAK